MLKQPGEARHGVRLLAAGRRNPLPAPWTTCLQGGACTAPKPACCPCHPAPPQAPAHLRPMRPSAVRHAAVLALPGGMVLRRGLPARGVAGEGSCAWGNVAPRAYPMPSKGPLHASCCFKQINQPCPLLPAAGTQAGVHAACGQAAGVKVGWDEREPLSSKRRQAGQAVLAHLAMILGSTREVCNPCAPPDSEGQAF